MDNIKVVEGKDYIIHGVVKNWLDVFNYNFHFHSDDLERVVDALQKTNDPASWKLSERIVDYMDEAHGDYEKLFK